MTDKNTKKQLPVYDVIGVFYTEYAIKRLIARRLP